MSTSPLRKKVIKPKANDLIRIENVDEFEDRLEDKNKIENEDLDKLD